jgi:ribose transport system substrate-binding protein
VNRSLVFVLRLCFILMGIVMLIGLVNNLQVIFSRPLIETTPVRSTNHPLRFIIVAPQSDHPYWAQIMEGAQAAGRELNVNVEATAPRRASLTEQAQLLDMATAAQVDGIITQGALDQQIQQAVAGAVDRGIPVITVDYDVSGRRLAYIGSDNKEAGRRMALELIRRTGGKAVVGIVRGQLGPEETDLRVQGFKEGLSMHPGIKIVAIESSEMNRTVAGQKALQIWREHPDITVFYGTTALDAVGVAQSVTGGTHGPILVLGWDDVGDAEDYLTRGAIAAVVSQQPWEMGHKAVQQLEAYLRRDQRPPTSTLLSVTIRQGGEHK